MDAYWQDKIADLEQIEIPAYIVASYTNTIHTLGTFEGYRRISSKKKWLRVHDNNEWKDYYTPENCGVFLITISKAKIMGGRTLRRGGFAY